MRLAVVADTFYAIFKQCHRREKGGGVSVAGRVRGRVAKTLGVGEGRSRSGSRSRMPCILSGD